jgi:hypothetical protein
MWNCGFHGFTSLSSWQQPAAIQTLRGHFQPGAPRLLTLGMNFIALWRGVQLKQTCRTLARNHTLQVMLSTHRMAFFILFPRLDFLRIIVPGFQEAA